MADDEILPVAEQEDTPTPIYAQLAEARTAADKQMADSTPGLGGEVLGAIGTVLGTAARPVQTAMYGLLTGRYDIAEKAGESVYNPEVAKDFSDIRKDVIGLSPESDDKTWFGNGVGNFASKLGTGAVDLVGGAVTDPLTLINPLSLTKAAVAVRSIQEGAQAEIIQGGRTYLKAAAARAGHGEGDLAHVAQMAKPIEDRLAQSIREEATIKGLTEEQLNQKLMKNSERVFQFTEGAAGHVEIAPQINQRLALAEKELGVKLPRVDEWHPPQAGTFDEVEKSYQMYVKTMNKQVDELLPKRMGDQVNAGMRNLLGIGNPFSEAMGGYNLGLKNPGAALNKMADLRDGVVQSMEATAVGRTVLDAKDWFSQAIMNPAGRGAEAMLERLSMSAPNTMMQQLGQDSLKAYTILEKAGFDADKRALAGRYFTAYGVEGEAQKGIMKELQSTFLDKLDKNQLKALAEAKDIRQSVMERVIAAENKVGIDKGNLGKPVQDVVKTMKETLEERRREFVEVGQAERNLQTARSEINFTEGKVAEDVVANRHGQFERAVKAREAQEAHNVGMKAQASFEGALFNGPEMQAAKAELEQLKLTKASYSGKMPSGGLDRRAEIPVINKAIADKQAEITGMKAQAESAAQATRHLAQTYHEGPAAFYAKSGVSATEALSLAKNRAQANAVELAGLPAQHSADTFNALRRGLNQHELGQLKEGLAHTDTPMPRNMWVEQHLQQGDPVSIGQAAAAEAKLQSLFQQHLIGAPPLTRDMGTVFDRMKAHLDVDAQVAREGRVLQKIKGKPVDAMPKYGPKFPKPESLADAQYMHLNEFIEASEKKVGTFFPNAPQREAFEKSHAEFIKRAIDRGESLPRAVLESHAGNAELAPGSVLWNANENNWRLGNGVRDSSNVAYRNTLAADVEQAQNLLKTASGGTDRKVLEVRLAALTEEVARFETAAKNVPNYVLNAMSEDALRKVVGARQAGLIKLHYSEIERQFTELGVPLSHGQVNDLIAGKPATIKGVAAVAAELPETTMPLNQILSLWRMGENDFTKLAEVASKVEGKKITPEMAKKMTVKERVKYYQQTYAKFFDERPEVLDALRIDEAAQAIKSKTYLDGIKNYFAQPIPFAERTAEETAARQAMMSRYRDLMKGATTAEEKRALEFMRDAIMKTNPEFKAGWVDAELIHPALKGQMVKKEVYNSALRYLDGMKNPAWMKGMMQHMATVNTWWKAMQLAVPGAAIRDWMGNLMLRFQNDGFHTQTLKDSSKLMKVMASGGEGAKLKDIVFEFPSGKMTGQEMHDHLLTQGVWGQGQAREVVQESMQGIAERGKVMNRLTSARNTAMTVMNLPQEFERTSMFHSRLMKGDSVASAAAAVDEALYNYARVSPFVDFTRKTGIIPFATWSSKNIPAQMELMVKHPGQFAAMMHAKAAMEGQSTIDGVLPEDVPTYVRDKWNLVMQRDPETGDISFVTLTGLVPMADISSIEHPGQFFGDLLGPLPKSGFESLFNVNLFTKKEMERFDGELTPLFKDDPDGFLISKRNANIFNSMVGRPAALANDVLGVYNDSKDKQGGDKTFWDRTATVSALTGVFPKQYKGTQQMLDKKRENEDIQRDIGIAQKAVQQAQARGSTRATEAYQQQLYKLQEERALMMSRRR